MSELLFNTIEKLHSIFIIIVLGQLTQKYELYLERINCSLTA